MKGNVTDATNGLTAAHLREVLLYDRDTGIFRWRIKPARNLEAGAIAGSLNKTRGYWIIGINGKTYRAHRLAWLYVYGEWPPDELDHKDLVRSHNWISNLRLAGQAMNNANRRRYRNNKSGFKGVFRHPQGRWQAMIRKDRKGIYIGLYDTPEEAHRAYCAKAVELFGEFANDGG